MDLSKIIARFYSERITDYDSIDAIFGENETEIRIIIKFSDEKEERTGILTRIDDEIIFYYDVPDITITNCTISKEIFNENSVDENFIFNSFYVEYIRLPIKGV